MLICPTCKKQEGLIAELRSQLAASGEIERMVREMVGKVIVAIDDRNASLAKHYLVCALAVSPSRAARISEANEKIFQAAKQLNNSRCGGVPRHWKELNEALAEREKIEHEA